MSNNIIVINSPAMTFCEIFHILLLHIASYILIIQQGAISETFEVFMMYSYVIALVSELSIELASSLAIKLLHRKPWGSSLTTCKSWHKTTLSNFDLCILTSRTIFDTL